MFGLTLSSPSEAHVPKKTVVEEQQVLVFRLLSSLLPALPHHQQVSTCRGPNAEQGRDQGPVVRPALSTLRRLEALSPLSPGLGLWPGTWHPALT